MRRLIFPTGDTPGNRLQSLRMRLGVPIQVMLNRANIQLPCLLEHEASEIPPSPWMSRKLAEGLGVDAHWLEAYLLEARGITKEEAA